MSKSKKSKWIRTVAVAMLEIAIIYIVFFAVLLLPVLLSKLLYGA